MMTDFSNVDEDPFGYDSEFDPNYIDNNSQLNEEQFELEEIHVSDSEVMEDLHNNFDSIILTPDMTKVAKEFYIRGYRQGCIEKESEVVQETFNTKYINSLKLGKVCGKIYNNLILSQKSNINSHEKIKQNFFLSYIFNDMLKFYSSNYEKNSEGEEIIIANINEFWPSCIDPEIKKEFIELFLLYPVV